MELGEAKRILILGCGGAGKSTLARRLGAATGLPVVHLDGLYWQPGWVAMERAAWRRTVENEIAKDAWIIDGNFGSSLEPLCGLRTARRACHCCHGAQGRQQCGRSHLQRPCLFCRRNAGPFCQRVERIKERPSDRFLREQRQCRIDTGSPCLTNREGLFVIQKGCCTAKSVQQPLKK